MRDNQKQRVYSSEFIFRDINKQATESGNPVVTMNGITVTLPPEAKFGNVESIQTYVDRVLQMPSVIEEFGDRGPVRVRERRGAMAAHYEPGNSVIAIPVSRSRWAMREIVVIHELAHALSWNSNSESHGPEFAQTMITLAGLVIGPEAALILRMIFDDNDVQTNRKKKAA